MPQTGKAPRTHEQRRELSEKQMLKAAIALFARQGYLKTTLTEVGREAGYTAGLVSHKFGSKEGLLQAVVDHISKRFLNDQLGKAIQQTSATESIRNYIDIYLTEVSLREGPMRALYVIMGEALGAEARRGRRRRRRLVVGLHVGLRQGARAGYQGTGQLRVEPDGEPLE